MLVRADAIPVVELVKSAEAVDAGAAALWVHMACFDALNEEIAKARPEIDRVWKAVVGRRSEEGRRLLVRKAIERRVEGGEIDDIVKAAAGLSLVRGVLFAKADGDDEHSSLEVYNESEQGHIHPKDAEGKFAPKEGQKPGSPQRELNSAHDFLRSLTDKDTRLSGQAESVATQLNGPRYDRMRVLGNAMVATGHPSLQVAGGVTRVASEVGPSAEQVLGPHLRRIAYRYRGTEKRPDQQLVRETKEAQAYVSGLSANPRTDQERAYQAKLQNDLDTRAPGEWGKGAVAYHLAQADRKGYSEDQLEMRATGDVAAAHLSRGLPTIDQALLSQESGRTPPSIGVMIDQDGDVVSEAQGFQGDHFVPFDLKNLKRLRGGSYVRTRAVGGPTSEDIYTGLLTGARQMQVVSRSGLFTVEFDPDLRGGRRYSDKAKQMVDRYARILDRIDRSQRATSDDEAIYTQDVSPERKRELKAIASDQADYDPEDTKRRYERALAKERAKLSLGVSDEELQDRADAELEDWVRNQHAAGKAPTRTEVGRMRDQVLSEVRDSAREENQAQQVRRIQLDAEGYFRALQSLQKEFPFFIRDVDFESLRDFEQRRRIKGRGEPLSPRSAPPAGPSFVRRGSLMPKTQADAYGITPQGRPKTGERGAEGDDGDEETGAAPKARTPSGSGGGGGAAALPALAERLQDPEYATGLETAASLFRNVDSAAEKLGITSVDPFPKRAEAIDDLNGPTYLKWLTSSNNDVTHGGSQHGINDFITRQASERELEKIKNGLKQVEDAGLDQPAAISAQRARDAIKLIDRVQLLHYPFAEASGDPGLHSPDPERPKPYPFKEVVGADPDDPEALKKVRTQLGHDDRFEDAFNELGKTSEDTIARQLNDEVRSFNAIKDWGAKITSNRQKNLSPPARPAAVKGTVSADDAELIAADPEKSVAYKALLAKQKVYAYKRMERVLEEAGGEGPKVQSGPVSARYVPRRRVVWHSPDDPIAKAYARRLNNAHAMTQASRRRGRLGRV